MFFNDNLKNMIINKNNDIKYEELETQYLKFNSIMALRYAETYF